MSAFRYPTCDIAADAASPPLVTYRCLVAVSKPRSRVLTTTDGRPDWNRRPSPHEHSHTVHFPTNVWNLESNREPNMDLWRRLVRSHIYLLACRLLTMA
jgi:hypothetical protein